MALLDAMERGDVPTRDLSAFTARQLLGLNDKNLSDKLTKVWGVIRPPSADKTKLLAHYLSLTPPDALKKADRSHGRAIFARTCAKCHTLFDDGGKIGPDLTGSQRVNPGIRADQGAGPQRRRGQGLPDDGFHSRPTAAWSTASSRRRTTRS